ncbi:hypothetical protein AC792_14820 [Arthrobacter sp. RIT-PI-e]|uniref:hypothetical protein n=1 Tax=Arthrobacter sp. RIT-PI-e TaxID=1681197 RepID=UPI00067693B2|nr:hypothetical protein [Arthrobacter sp. RIT-PI-e]KNC17211.1 hypothetical protein AC792_14820 [Arthrobacter sp. RIT-PI-e]
MKLHVKHYLTGLALLFLSTLFVPQAVADFAHSASTGAPVPDRSPFLLVIGLLIILAAVAIIGRGYWLAHRNGTPRTHPEDDPDEPLLRPGYGPASSQSETWREHPLRRSTRDPE